MAQTIDEFFKAVQDSQSKFDAFKAAKEHYLKTGDFMGADFGISINPDAGPEQAPMNWPKSAIEALDPEDKRRKFIDEKLHPKALAERELSMQGDVSTAGFRAERKKMRVAQNITDIEDLTDDEFMSLAKRNQELHKLKTSDPQAFNKIFNPDVTIPGTNEKLMYAVHSGAPELSQGSLDPSFSIGRETQSSGTGGDTKGANRGKARDLRERAENVDGFESKSNMAVYQRQMDIITDSATQERRLAGEIIESANFMSAAPPSVGVSVGYIGRTEWGDKVRPLAKKTTEESIELASDLNATTGGRGTMYLVRGVKDYTINTGLLGADPGETPILGKHKPLSGLSIKKQNAVPLAPHGLMHDEIKLDANPKRIDLAWLEKQINEDVGRVTAGKVPLEEIFGPAAEHAGIKSAGLTQSVPFTPPKALIESMAKADQTVAARVASKQIPRTVEEGVAVAVRRSGATEGLLRAASQASGAVAAGTSNSAGLRGAGAALSILRGVI
jgi:hypothetical protein